MKYDIFISYRREGGEYTAKILHDKLTDLGYKVFFDVESLRSGQFNAKLFSVIDECEDFISILSPNCLDRCENEDDWVRLEIAHALKSRKNVIPVLLRGFIFPEKLSEDIDKIRYQSGIEASPEFFDAFAKRLTEFLSSKPQIFNRLTQNTLFKKVLPLSIALLIVFGIVFSGYKIYQNTRATFPVSKTDKNTVSEVVYYISENFGYTNIAMLEYDNAISGCHDYFDNPTELNFTTLKSDLEYRKGKVAEAQANLDELDDTLSAKLDKTTNLPKKDIIAVKDFLNQFVDEMLQNIDFMSSLADGSMISKTTKTQLLDNYKELLNIEKNLIFYGVNDIFLEINEEALKEFKTEILPTVPYIYDGQEWRDNKEEIKAITDTEFSKYQNILIDIASIIGNENIKTDAFENKVNELQEVYEELDDINAEAREKFKPLESDDINLLWGKMLRYNSLKMYDMCIQCLMMYKEKADTEETDIIIPIAIEYFNQIGTTGINYGCMVGGYEPDKPQNSFYKLGDILIEMNGQKIMTFDDMSSARGDTSSNFGVKVLRYNGSGFEIIEEELQAKESKVLLYDMCEKLDE